MAPSIQQSSVKYVRGLLMEKKSWPEEQSQNQQTVYF